MTKSEEKHQDQGSETIPVFEIPCVGTSFHQIPTTFQPDSKQAPPKSRQSVTPMQALCFSYYVLLSGWPLRASWFDRIVPWCGLFGKVAPRTSGCSASRFSRI